jgi:GlcNAc-P-P-Und epimerase
MRMSVPALNVGVIGGAGFIGLRLAERLVAKGHRVRVGDLREAAIDGAEFVRCDITDRESVDTFVRGLDVVFNLAAEHRDDVRPVERYALVNIEGSRNVCHAAKAHGIRRIVFTSSVAVYGLPAGPVSEDAPCAPFNEYGRTKLLAEELYRAWSAEDHGRTLVVVRPTVVFGEGNRGNVYNLAHQVAAGRFVMVGNGRNRKSMAYVENVADFLIHVLSITGGTHTFNYADGPDFDMNALVSTMRERLGKRPGIPFRVPYSVGKALGRAADTITDFTGKSLPFSSVRVEKFCASTQVVSERARQTGFQPAIPVQDAVERFLTNEFPSAE